MLATKLREELTWCIANYGDRDVQFIGVKGKNYEELFIENIRSIHATTNYDKEPIRLYGDSAMPIYKEKLIKLNLLGVLLKRFITK